MANIRRRTLWLLVLGCSWNSGSQAGERIADRPGAVAALPTGVRRAPAAARPLGGGPALQWTYSTNAPLLASPRLADLDGDRVQDIVFTSYGDGPNPYLGGTVHALDATGAPLPNWPKSTGSPIPASPAVADLDGDHVLDVVVPTWNRLYAWTGQGALRRGFPLAIASYEATALADLDADADLEIVLAGADSLLYVLDPDGRLLPGWPFRTAGHLVSPAVADLDRDGTPEIVSGTNRPWADEQPYAIYAWEPDGSVRPGFPVRTAGSVRAPVALGDLDADGRLEIVAIALHHSNFDSLYVLDGDGAIRPGWPVGVQFARVSPPALGDLDADGDLEILLIGMEVPFTTAFASAPCPGGFGEILHAFHDDGRAVQGWPSCLAHDGMMGTLGASAVVANLDADTTDVELLARATDWLFALHADGTLVDGFPVFESDFNWSGGGRTPTVDDVDGDGDLEMVSASAFDLVQFYDLGVPAAARRAHWPTYKHDARNSGAWAPPERIVPVLVADLAARVERQTVHLSWTLGRDGLAEIAGVHVQRAAAPSGPYVDRTPSALSPAVTMRFEDDIEAASEIWYRLRLVGEDGTVAFAGPVEARRTPRTTWLAAPAVAAADGPIPVRFGLARDGATRVRLFDARGRLVHALVDGRLPAGEHAISWSGQGRLPHGVYLLELRAGPTRQARKIVLVP